MAMNQSPGSLQMQLDRLAGQCQEQQAKLDSLIEENNNLKKEKNERSALARGEFFAQLRDVIETEQTSFEDGFKNICGRFNKDDSWRKTHFPEYETIVLEMKALAEKSPSEVKQDELTFVSESAAAKNVIQKVGIAQLTPTQRQILEHNHEAWRRAARSSSGNSRSRDEQQDEGKVLLVDSGTVANDGHLLAGDASCGPCAGLFVQSIVGFNLESYLQAVSNKGTRSLTKNHVDYSALKTYVYGREVVAVAALRSLAYHQRNYKGFCHLPRNSLYVPKSGHEQYFDIQGSWIIVPILELNDIIGWVPRQRPGYWVMFIAGTLKHNDHGAYVNFLQASTSDQDGEHIFIPNRRERCTESDVRIGIDNLRSFVKAFADLATGRTQDERTPLDLATDHKKPHDVEGLKEAQRTLNASKQVTVPKLKDFQDDTTNVMKLFISHEVTEYIPDPMAVAGKGALNWMLQVGEKAIPASVRYEMNGSSAGEESPEKKHDEILYSCTSSYINDVYSEMGDLAYCHLWPDDIPESIAVVTPEKETSSSDDDGDGNDSLTQGSFDSHLDVDADIDVEPMCLSFPGTVLSSR